MRAVNFRFGDSSGHIGCIQLTAASSVSFGICDVIILKIREIM